ncbi:nucleotide pyrophosphohydrolase [Bacillus sp. DJP31]|uniref:nucleotide pyrophosphohydrolase n=1 Tax=Bacillus sp. DJP31 TaxID=3409789 RepID=UPI003BB59648
MITKFRDERGWKSNHKQKDLAISISLEANELLGNSQWRTNEEAIAESRQNIKEEMADVLIYFLQLADSMGVDLEEEAYKEIKKNALKYPVPQKSEILVSEQENLIITRMKEKLNQCGGRTTILLLKGEQCDIWFTSLASTKIPVPNQLTLEAFIAAVELVVSNGGKAKKGNARAGKLGSVGLTLDSGEGYIAHNVKEGESAFEPGFGLDWAGICRNERGSTGFIL